MQKNVYIKRGFVNNCYLTYIKTANNSPGFCVVETNLGCKIASFSTRGIRGDMVGEFRNGYFKLWAAEGPTYHIAENAIVFSFSEVLEIAGHDS